MNKDPASPAGFFLPAGVAGAGNTVQKTCTGGYAVATRDTKRKTALPFR